MRMCCSTARDGTCTRLRFDGHGWIFGMVFGVGQIHKLGGLSSSSYRMGDRWVGIEEYISGLVKGNEGHNLPCRLLRIS
jgi:hypothetical protein